MSRERQRHSMAGGVIPKDALKIYWTVPWAWLRRKQRGIQVTWRTRMDRKGRAVGEEPLARRSLDGTLALVLVRGAPPEDWLTRSGRPRAGAAVVGDAAAASALVQTPAWQEELT